MRQSVSIGQIWGIEIRLHASLLLIALLVTVSSAFGFLPSLAPGYSVLVYLAAGSMIAVLFIVSILWHELAHALVALRFRLPVIQIVLYLFGGMAQIGREPERPVHEFWIAIAGPVSSAALALLFNLVTFVGGLGGAAAWYLATVNLSLALFNLLPGFPLDGGRVLRAVLWQIEGSYTRATRQASRAGQIVAILLALFGALSLLIDIGGFAINGLWLILIAFFLFSTATSQRRVVRAVPLPADTLVRRVMRFNVPEISPDWPLAMFAWRYFDHAADQAFPVMEAGELVGLVAAAQLDPIPRLEWGKIYVREAMLPRDRLPIVAPDDELAAALAAIDAQHAVHAPVMERGRLVGMLNRRDITYRT